MASITLKRELFPNLKDKVVVITGASSGIGLAASKIVTENGGYVVNGDLRPAAEADKSVTFVKTDVADWDSVSNLFETAQATYGKIDHVIVNAGLPEKVPDFFEDKIDEKTGKLQEPSYAIIDVNLKGGMNCTKLAMYYFEKNPSTDKSIVFTSSAGAYHPCYPIVRYGASKHGILGFFRAVAQFSRLKDVRVNLLAPWMTATPLSNETDDAWGDYPKNTPEEVADALVLTLVDTSLHGAGIWVAPGLLSDCEAPLRRLQPEWMGKKQSELFDGGAQRLVSRFPWKLEFVGSKDA